MNTNTLSFEGDYVELVGLLKTQLHTLINIENELHGTGNIHRYVYGYKGVRWQGKRIKKHSQ